MSKVQVSLKNMMKASKKEDQGFLVECHTLQGMEILEAFYGVDDNFSPEDALSKVLQKYDDVFQWPEELPPSKGIDHH